MSAKIEAPKVCLTLAVLVHNPRTSFLEQLLRSIQQQQGCYVVDIIDDSSLPITALETNRYNLPGYRYLRHEDNDDGLSGNWRYALEHTRTPWVSVLHQDDVLAGNYTSIIGALINRYSEATAVFCDADIIDHAGERTASLADGYKKYLLRQFDENEYLLKEESGASSLLRGNFIFCPSVCFNVNKLGHERFDARWKQVPDLELYFRLLLAGHEVVGCKDVGFYYRRHSDQATAINQQDGLRFDEEFELYRELATKFEERGWVKAQKLARKARILKLHVAKDILVSLLTGKLKKAKALANYL